MVKGKPLHVCLNFTSSLSHIEFLGYDVDKGEFQHLDSEPVMFDPATREYLEEPERLITSVKRLYERNRVPLKTPTALVLPSFFTRDFAVPDYVLEEELKGILTAEAERFYVFKKIDPEIGFAPIINGQVLYTAYPKPPLEFITDTLKAMKIPVFSVDINYTATLRGLVSMGVVQEEIESQLKWGLMILSDFTLFMAVVEGGNIIKILEAPLPMENSEEGVLLSEIKEDFQQFYGFEVLNRLVVINNSIKVYSTGLVQQLEFQGATNLFDQNERTVTSFNDNPESPFPCTLEAVGGALIHQMPEIPALELFEGDDYQALQQEERKNWVAYGLIAAGLLLFLAQTGIGSMIDSFNKTKTDNNTKLETDITNKTNSLTLIPVVKQKLYVKTAVLQNYKLNNLMFLTMSKLPVDAWLKSFSLKSPDDLKSVTLDLEGETKSSDPLNTYVQDLNTELGQPPLTPKIQPEQKGEQRYFSFSLSNNTLGGASGGTTP